MQAVAFRLPPGADLKDALVDYCVTQGIEAACIIGCVGSLQGAHIRFAGQPEGVHLEGRLEILSLSGTVSLHGAHFHVAVANERGELAGGHLVSGSPVYTTAEIVLGILPGMIFHRTFDALTGYKELEVRAAAPADPGGATT